MFKTTTSMAVKPKVADLIVLYDDDNDPTKVHTEIQEDYEFDYNDDDDKFPEEEDGFESQDSNDSNESDESDDDCVQDNEAEDRRLVALNTSVSFVNTVVSVVNMVISVVMLYYVVKRS